MKLLENEVFIILFVNALKNVGGVISE